MRLHLWAEEGRELSFGPPGPLHPPPNPERLRQPEGACRPARMLDATEVSV